MPLGLPQQFTTIDWDNIPVTEHLGDSGTAYWKTQQYDGVRVRVVRYSPGYLADQVKGQPSVTLTAGQSYVVADGASSHRSRTTNGATLFIVD
jgi:hypothetical protein